MNRGLRALLSLVTGSIIAAGVAYFSNSILLAAGAGVVSTLASYPLFKRFGNQYIAGSYTKDEAARIKNEARPRLARMQMLMGQIPDYEIRAKVKGILSLMEELLTSFEKDPKDILTSRRFINYHMNSTLEILEKFAELTRRSVLTEEQKANIKKIEALLDPINTAFHQQISRVDEGERLDLTTEIKILEDTLRMDGVMKLAPGNETKPAGSDTGQG